MPRAGTFPQNMIKGIFLGKRREANLLVLKKVLYFIRDAPEIELTCQTMCLRAVIFVQGGESR